ncbi:MAG: aldo/keto reductase [Calditrichaeota bacterium]|nr:MAG: aldo/keto reductase [Calditrichota bacterium]
MTKKISGFAEAKATKNYLAKYKITQTSVLGKTGLSVSEVGFGCYRIGFGQNAHLESLELALSSGINLIDTSSTYTDGNSETIVGTVLEDLINKGKLRRNEVVVVTKGGYAQGKNYEICKKREELGNPFPEIVEVQEGLWHCIHPEFLEDQLNRSLERLGLESVDVYLLHNPEYFIEFSVKKQGNSVEETGKIYLERITKAFEFLEEKVKEGKIKSYGISSNTFPSSSDFRKFTPLDKIYKIAQVINPNHNFKVIQLPANLLEKGIVTEKNQMDNNQTVNDFCFENNIGVLINRPLNAIVSNTLLRLADFKTEKFSELEFGKAVLGLRNSQDAVIAIAERHNLPEAKDYLTLADFFKENLASFGSIENWNDFEQYRLLPTVNYGLRLLQEKDDSETSIEIYKKYVSALKNALSSMTNYNSEIAQERSKKLHKTLTDFFSDEEISLSNKAILSLRAIPSVSCVLVGMRQQKYVEDVLSKINEIPPSEWKKLWTKE